MKGVVALLLFVAVAVQGRSTVLEPETGVEVASVSPGSDPWVVHLRVAVATSGFLNTCVGTVVSRRHVYTAAACLLESRFIWVRMGMLNVWNPEFVIETSSYSFHPDFNPNGLRCNAALVNLNRDVEFTPTIRPIPIETIEQMYEEFRDARFCGFGEEDNRPGTDLQCFNMNCLESLGNRTTCSCNVATNSDIGAPLVRNGLLRGFLIRVDEDVAVFRRIGSFEEWISEVIRFFV